MDIELPDAQRQLADSPGREWVVASTSSGRAPTHFEPARA